MEDYKATSRNGHQLVDFYDPKTNTLDIRSNGQYPSGVLSNLCSNVPEGVVDLGKWAFRGCRSLCKVSLPSTLKSIGIGAFQDCKMLCQLTLPDGLEYLHLNAFKGCKALLETLAIPPGCLDFEGRHKTNFKQSIANYDTI